MGGPLGGPCRIGAIRFVPGQARPPVHFFDFCGGWQQVIMHFCWPQGPLIDQLAGKQSRPYGHCIHSSMDDRSQPLCLRRVKAFYEFWLHFQGVSKLGIGAMKIVYPSQVKLVDMNPKLNDVHQRVPTKKHHGPFLVQVYVRAQPEKSDAGAHVSEDLLLKGIAGLQDRMRREPFWLIGAVSLGVISGPFKRSTREDSKGTFCGAGLSQDVRWSPQTGLRFSICCDCRK